MVETVLSRDKNWIRWKIENCPSIERPPVPPEEFRDAKKALHRATAPRPLRQNPMGSMSLDFLKNTDEASLFERLKSNDRYQLPDLETFKAKIADDDFDIDTARDPESKAEAVERKYSKSWRALRIAGRTKMSMFDRIDDPSNIDAIFEEKVDPDEEEAEEEANKPAEDEAGGDMAATEDEMAAENAAEDVPVDEKAEDKAEEATGEDQGMTDVPEGG